MRLLGCAAAFVLSIGGVSAHACTHDDPDPLSERLRSARHVFLARIDQVTFHSVTGDDRRATSLALVPNNKEQARSLWWDGQATNVQNLRGNAPARIQLRFDGNRCGGVRFVPGNWYLFAVSDFDREILIGARDMKAIREMAGLDGSADARAIGEAATMIRAALDPSRPRALDLLQSMSDDISAVRPPPLPASRPRASGP